MNYRVNSLNFRVVCQPPAPLHALKLHLVHITRIPSNPFSSLSWMASKSLMANWPFHYFVE